MIFVARKFISNVENYEYTTTKCYKAFKILYGWLMAINWLINCISHHIAKLAAMMMAARTTVMVVDAEAWFGATARSGGNHGVECGVDDG